MLKSERNLNVISIAKEVSSKMLTIRKNEKEL